MLTLLDRVINVFRPDPPPVAAASLRGGDIAWADASVLYRSADFPKYNPDNLIGRKGYAVYTRMMLDEQVKAVVKFKRDAITARDWLFDCDDLDLSDEDKERRKAKITDAASPPWMGHF